MKKNQENEAEHHGGNAGTSEEPKPNPNIKPPDYMTVTEGFDPSKLKTALNEKDKE
jgi:hypothetical protein